MYLLYMYVYILYSRGRPIICRTYHAQLSSAVRDYNWHFRWANFVYIPKQFSQTIFDHLTAHASCPTRLRCINDVTHRNPRGRVHVISKDQKGWPKLQKLHPTCNKLELSYDIVMLVSSACAGGQMGPKGFRSELLGMISTQSNT